MKRTRFTEESRSSLDAPHWEEAHWRSDARTMEPTASTLVCVDLNPAAGPRLKRDVWLRRSIHNVMQRSGQEVCLVHVVLVFQS
jgi:hypothetical protein